MEVSEALGVIKECRSPSREPCPDDCPVKRQILVYQSEGLTITMGICDLLTAVEEELKHPSEPMR